MAKRREREEEEPPNAASPFSSDFVDEQSGFSNGFFQGDIVVVSCHARLNECAVFECVRC